MSLHKFYEENEEQYALPFDVAAKLYDYLASRESDIANDIEDFGELEKLFTTMFKREPKDC